MQKKLLVTGFKPFLGESINPSELLVQELQNTPGVSTLTLPVSYEKSFSALKHFWNQHGPFQGLLMLGQAGGRKTVCLERVAVNWCESNHPDEEGVHPMPGPIVNQAPSSYISDFFPRDWKDQLSPEGLVSVSLSAGGYVCNSLYFQTLHEYQKLRIPILFVHVPYLPEQVTTKTESPSMELKIQKKIVTDLVNLLLKR